jgi:hypothetical protein
MMKPVPTYLESLANWVRETEGPKRRRTLNVAAFLAVRDDVQAAFNAGFPMKAVWAHLTSQGRLSCHYETFLKHVRRHIADTAKPEASMLGTAPVSVSAAVPASPTEPRRTDTSVPGFKYEPAPRKEDLF